MTSTALSMNQTTQAQAPMQSVQNAAESAAELPHKIVGRFTYSFTELYGLWPIIIAAAIVVTLLLLGLFYILRKRKGKPEQPKIPHLELVVRALNHLDFPDPFVEPKKTEYFFELSMRVRAVIEEIFKFPATDSTIREIREQFRRDPDAKQLEFDKLLALLERCELIKFAKSETDAQEARDCHQQACALIQMAAEFKKRVQLSKPEEVVSGQQIAAKKQTI